VSPAVMGTVLAYSDLEFFGVVAALQSVWSTSDDQGNAKGPISKKMGSGKVDHASPYRHGGTDKTNLCGRLGPHPLWTNVRVNCVQPQTRDPSLARTCARGCAGSFGFFCFYWIYGESAWQTPNCGILDLFATFRWTQICTFTCPDIYTWSVKIWYS
jgi:hypothetical protein